MYIYNCGTKKKQQQHPKKRANNKSRSQFVIEHTKSLSLTHPRTLLSSVHNL